MSARDTNAEANAHTTVVSKTVEIDAPAEHVWSVLVDVERYPEWNPFTVRVETDLAIGSPVVLHLPDPNAPGSTFTTTEYIRIVDAPRQLQYDTADSLDGMLAVRDQWVEPLGDDRCSYCTTDAFSGEHAELVFGLQSAWVQAGFDSVADALKERAEALWSPRS